MLSKIKTYLTALLLTGAFATSTAQANEDDILDILKSEFKRPDTITFPKDAPYSPQVATLGKMLFFDQRLSKNQNISCASCHNPSLGWEIPIDKAIGSLNIKIRRHAPTVVNLASAKHFNWDGRATSLEQQAMGPITDPTEMGNSFPALIGRLSRIEGYNHWFKTLFPEEGITSNNILRALATFQRTLESGWTPFDEWVNGDEDAISANAKRGFELFTGKSGCIVCHSGWRFTDDKLYDIGLVTNDMGAGAVGHVKGREKRKHQFKTPGLRNVAIRAPYMHNGSLSTLDDVIDHITTGGVDRKTRTKFLPTPKLTKNERNDLIAFLDTLTDPHPNVAAPSLPAR